MAFTLTKCRQCGKIPFFAGLDAAGLCPQCSKNAYWAAEAERQRAEQAAAAESHRESLLTQQTAAEATIAQTPKKASVSDCSFVAIDFETATNSRDSACSIGIVRVEGGKIVDKFYSLIQPPNNEYASKNISIHGITPEMTENSPSFPELWEKISQYFLGDIVIAHNASFDMSVLKNSLCGKVIPNFWYTDSAAMARNYVPGSCSLDACAEYLAVFLDDHHNALADAEACAEIVLRCLSIAGCDTVEDICTELDNLKICSFENVKECALPMAFSPKTPSHLPEYAKVRPSDIYPKTKSFNCSSPLYQKTIVFTGSLHIDRATAMQIAVDCGAVVRTSVSSKTNYLVVGEQDISLVGDDGMSSKEEKAYELNDLGKANIEIIGEEDFLELAGQIGAYC